MTTTPELRLLFDADVLIKLSVLDCFADALESLGVTIGECATMRSMTRSAGVDNQVVRESRAGVGKASRRLFATLRAIPTIDRMSESERALCTRIIGASQTAQLYVDGGEAMLMSVCFFRNLPYVTTGDKKAIISLPQLSETVPEIKRLERLVMPLEYLLLRLVQSVGYDGLEARLLAGRTCDLGLSRMLDEAAGAAAHFEALIKCKLTWLGQAAPGFLRSWV